MEVEFKSGRLRSSGLTRPTTDEKKPKSISSQSPHNATVPFLAFDLVHLPRMSQFFILATAVFVFYVVSCANHTKCIF